MLPNYMENQPDITRDMRAILVDWMVEVQVGASPTCGGGSWRAGGSPPPCRRPLTAAASPAGLTLSFVLLQENFELTHETLYLAVKLLDHYLAQVTTMRDKLQLIGSTAILIASKFEVSLKLQRPLDLVGGGEEPPKPRLLWKQCRMGLELFLAGCAGDSPLLLEQGRGAMTACPPPRSAAPPVWTTSCTSVTMPTSGRSCWPWKLASCRPSSLTSTSLLPTDSSGALPR